MKRKITVTQEDIEKGIRLSSRFCPVARATSRKTEGIGWAGPFEMGFSLYKTKNGETVYQSYSAKVPQEVRDFIIKFDRYNHVEPFSFTVDFKGNK